MLYYVFNFAKAGDSILLFASVWHWNQLLDQLRSADVLLYATTRERH